MVGTVMIDPPTGRNQACVGENDWHNPPHAVSSSFHLQPLSKHVSLPPCRPFDD